MIVLIHFVDIVCSFVVYLHVAFEPYRKVTMMVFNFYTDFNFTVELQSLSKDNSAARMV